MHWFGMGLVNSNHFLERRWVDEDAPQRFFSNSNTHSRAAKESGSHDHNSSTSTPLVPILQMSSVKTPGSDSTAENRCTDTKSRAKEE